MVRSIAKAEGILSEELEKIPGTGKNGRVTKKDILAYLPNRGNAIEHPVIEPTETIVEKVVKTPPPQAVQSTGNDEIIEMDRMRKLIADHMVNSVQTAPHVTSFVEADVTNIVLWRNKIKNQFWKK